MPALTQWQTPCTKAEGCYRVPEFASLVKWMHSPTTPTINMVPQGLEKRDDSFPWDKWMDFLEKIAQPQDWVPKLFLGDDDDDDEVKNMTITIQKVSNENQNGAKNIAA